MLLLLAAYMPPLRIPYEGVATPSCIPEAILSRIIRSPRYDPEGTRRGRFVHFGDRGNERRDGALQGKGSRGASSCFARSPP